MSGVRHATRGKALVLGSGNQSFLAVVRSLGRQGIAVHVGWHGDDCASRCSRYIAQRHALPPYHPEETAWLEVLGALLEAEQFDLVIPCTDLTVIPLQAQHAFFARFPGVHLLPEACYDTVSNKKHTDALARSLGIPVPDEICLSHVGDVPTVLTRFALPIVLKPLSSFTPHNLRDRHDVRKAYTGDECAVYAAAMLRHGEVLAQENFIGVGMGVEVLARDGEVLFAFQHVRVHEPLYGGGSSYRKSAPLHPALLAATKTLLAALRYTGVAMCEFKMNLQTGTWVFLEINARFWGSLPLAVAAGADFPYYLYQMFVEGRHDFPARYTHPLYGRNLKADLAWLSRNVRANHQDPTLETRPLLHVAAEVVNLLRLRERSDTLAVDDPLPALCEAGHIARTVSMTLLRNIGTRLPRRRRRAQRRALQALRAAHTVLFVCKGNIYRSPFAHRYIQAQARHPKTILSAGYLYEADRRSPLEAVIAAQRWQVDLSAHRSQVLTTSQMDTADLILTFDEDTHAALRAQYPHAAAKVHRFSALDTVGPLTIADPNGGRIDDVAAVYRRIAALLDTTHDLWERPAAETTTPAAKV